MNGCRRHWNRVWALGILYLLSAALAPVGAQQAVPENQVKADPPGAASSNVKSLRSTVEDWSEITLEKSELNPIDPVLGEFARMKTYTRARILVQWRDLDPIDLYVIKPVGVEKPPVILYLYSYEAATKQAFMNDGWCQRVTSGGFAAVAFVPALTEDRFRMRPMKEWFVSELQESLATTTHDVEMILNFLEKRNDFNMNRVGIFGVGSGATVGVLAAAADPRIKVLDLTNPWADWPMWLRTSSMVTPEERVNFLKPEFLGKVAPLDPIKWLPKLTTQTIRLQIIDQSIEQQKLAMDRLESVAPKNAKIAHFKTVAEHKGATVAAHGSFQWIKDQIQPPAPLRPEDSAQAVTDSPSVKP